MTGAALSSLFARERQALGWVAIWVGILGFSKETEPEKAAPEENATNSHCALLFVTDTLVFFFPQNHLEYYWKMSLLFFMNF